MAITETRSLPPQFVEDLGKDYATQLTGLTSQALDTTKFQPMVAGQDQATKDAYSRATTQGQGIGAYAPYLQQAGQFQTGTGTFAGTPTNMMGAQDYLQSAQAQAGAQGALSGPNAYQQFMSPYQQDVIDATMSEYDKQAQAGITNIGLGAAKSGNLGGGREGVMRAQYQNQSDMNRAMLNAKLLQEGFGNAQQAAGTAFTQTQQLGADQQRMATLLPQLQGSDISTLGQAGRGQQLFEQSILDQQREANRMAAYEPYERLGYMGAGMGNVMGGAMGQYQSQVTPNQSPLQQALGIASLGVGAYKAFKNP